MRLWIAFVCLSLPFVGGQNFGRALPSYRGIGETEFFLKGGSSGAFSQGRGFNRETRAAIAGNLGLPNTLTSLSSGRVTIASKPVEKMPHAKTPSTAANGVKNPSEVKSSKNFKTSGKQNTAGAVSAPNRAVLPKVSSVGTKIQSEKSGAGQNFSASASKKPSAVFSSKTSATPKIIVQSKTISQKASTFSKAIPRTASVSSKAMLRPAPSKSSVSKTSVSALPKTALQKQSALTLSKGVSQKVPVKTASNVQQRLSAVPKPKAAAPHTANSSGIYAVSSAPILKAPSLPAVSMTAFTRLSDVAKQCRLKYSVSGQNIVLSGGRRCFEFRNSTKEVTVDGIKVFLSFPIETEPIPTTKIKNLLHRLHLVKHEYRIRTEDVETVVKPLLFPQSFLKKRAKTIVIDPGHGGKAEGTVQNGLKEKQLTLKTAQLLAAKLRAVGYVVHLTRTGDVDVSLSQRTAFANAKHADLFVSVHYNSAPAKQACGIEIFTFPLAGCPSSDQVVAKDCDRMPINAFDGQNSFLGWQVQKKIIQSLGSVDRGVKRKRLGVLRELNCPGILIECGFLSNFEEAKACNTPSYQEKLTRAVTDGIRAYNGN